MSTHRRCANSRAISKAHYALLEFALQNALAVVVRSGHSHSGVLVPHLTEQKIASSRGASNETTPKKFQKADKCPWPAAQNLSPMPPLLIYRFGEFTLDVTTGSVFNAGHEVKLRPKVYETLK